MNELDLILCTVSVLLIWLLWQQLEKVKLEERRRKLSKGRSPKKVRKGSTQERIIIEETEINFKKTASSPAPPPASAALPPPPPPRPPPPLSPQPPPPTSQPLPISPTKTAIPTIPTVSSDEVKLPPPSPLILSSSPHPSPVPSTVTPMLKTPIVSPVEAKQAKKNLNKPDETGPEWDPLDKQEMPPQKPWVFEGEVYYPPNFFTAAHQSK